MAFWHRCDRQIREQYTPDSGSLMLSFAADPYGFSQTRIFLGALRAPKNDSWWDQFWLIGLINFTPLSFTTIPATSGEVQKRMVKARICDGRDLLEPYSMRSRFK